MGARGFLERRFLNLKRQNNGAAYVLIDHDIGSHYSDVKIADCDRVVSLSIDVSDAKETENSIHKIQTLIDVLSDYVEWLRNDWEEE